MCTMHFDHIHPILPCIISQIHPHLPFPSQLLILFFIFSTLPNSVCTGCMLIGVETSEILKASFRELTFVLLDFQSRTTNERIETKQIKHTTKIIERNKAPRLPKLEKMMGTSFS